MRIVQRGDGPRKAEIKCNICKSVLWAEESEIERMYQPRFGTWYEFICPVCKVRRTIDKVNWIKVHS